MVALLSSFIIDVGRGDPVVGEIEYLTTPDLLEFAGLEPVRVPCYPVTQMIAEKLHAYTRPRQSGESSRVKDLVDILMLANFTDIERERLSQAIRATFDSRETHPIPTAVPSPPASWSQAFGLLAKSVGLDDLTLAQAHERMQTFLDPILAGKGSGWWDPVSSSWEAG